MSRTARRTPARVFSQSAPPIFESFGVSPPVYLRISPMSSEST